MQRPAQRPSVDLTIERLGQLGEGIGSVEGHTVFVPGALPGERVRAQIREDGKVFRGTLESVLEPSPQRRIPPCPYAKRCGGCDWQHLDEQAQRTAREEIVLSALEHLGGIPRSGYERRPLLTAGTGLGYRRRALLHVFPAGLGGGLGYFAAHSHEPVAVAHCPALVPALQPMPGALAALLAPVAKEIEAVQLLAEGGASAASLSLKGRVRPRLLELAEHMCRELGFAGVVLLPKEGAPVLVGAPTLKAPAPGNPAVHLLLRPDGFTQANGALAPELVGSALTLLGAEKTDRVLELYSGNGFFTFGLAATAAHVTGVEGASLSSTLAQKSAAASKVTNVRFMTGDVRKVVEGLARERTRFELLLADPPRTGAPGLGSWAQKLEVRRVVYVACDAGSLARDAKGLLEHGFSAQTLQLVDMFPQTRHVEAVMSFERRG